MAIIVCKISVVVLTVLREVIGVGDPFMREDTVNPKFSSAEVYINSRIEPWHSKTQCQGNHGQQRDSADLGEGRSGASAHNTGLGCTAHGISLEVKFGDLVYTRNW